MASRRSIGVIVGLVALALVVAIGAVVLLAGDDHGRRPDEVLPPASDNGESVTDAAWSLDGSTLYVVDATGIDVLSGSPLARTERLESSRFQPGVTWSPDHSRVVLSDGDGAAEVWDLARGEVLAEIDTAPSPGIVAWSPDGESLATTGSDGTVTIRAADTGEAASSFAAFDSGYGVIGMAWPTADRLVAVATNRVTAVDVTTGEVVWSHSSGPDGFLAPSPDGAEVVTGQGVTHGHDVYSVGSGEVVGAVETDSRSLRAADWSPDGRWVLVAGDDERPTLWDAAASATTTEYPEVAPYSAGGSWSPDAQLVAVPDAYDQRLFVMDPTGSIDDEELSIAEDVVLSAVAWAPTGERLVAVGRDGTIFGWDVAP